MYNAPSENNEEQIKDTLGMSDIISVLGNEFINIYLWIVKASR